MSDLQTTPAPSSSGPLPPWRQNASVGSQPTPVPTNIPGPWSRPAPVQPSGPAAPQPQVAPAPEGPKDWGPIKPIRTVPKPDEQKVAYVLAQTEHVVNPDEEHHRKRWVILGSVIGFLVIVGGTFAFIFFGRSTQNPKLDSNNVTIVNTNVKNANASTNGVFPGANDNRNLNTNSAANLNQNANAAVVETDTDADGLSDASEVQRGTDPKKADTDGDGFKDGEEVVNGYNPLGAGKL